MEQRQAHRFTLLVLFVLLVAGALLRLAFLSQPMRLDESSNYVLLASRSFRTCVTSYPEANNHPLHTVLVHLSTLVLGNQPWCLRMPAFVAGVLLVPATYATMTELFDAPTGLLAAALVVPSASLVEYSTNARGYTLQALIVVLLVRATARVLRDPAPRRWGAFVLLSIAGFYTIPTMAYFFSAMVAWLLLSLVAGEGRSLRTRFVVRLAGASACVIVVVFLLYLPFIVASGLAALTSNRWVKSLAWDALRSGAWGALRGYAESWHRGLPLVASVVLVASFVVSLVVFRRVSTFRVNPIAVTLATCLAMMTLQRVLPPARVLLPCLPLYLGACAAGLRWLASRAAAWAQERDARLFRGSSGAIVASALTLAVAAAPGALVLGNGAAYQTSDQVRFRDAEVITLVLKELLRDGDVIYAQRDASFVLAYYFALHGVPTSHLYAFGDRRRIGDRVFVIDSSTEEPDFSYRWALGDSDLKRKEYELAVILELPHSTTYRVLDPERAN